MPGCDEHYLVHRLWNEPCYIPELSFVATVDEKIVGAIIYARSRIKTDYLKFGFKTADNFGITMPDGSNFDAFMGYELQKDALKGVTGKFYEADVFECDIHDEEYMKALDEFDKNYPYTKKKVLPHQWR